MVIRTSVGADAGRERMHGIVHPPCPAVEAHALRPPWPRDGAGARSGSPRAGTRRRRRRGRCATGGDQRHQLGLQLGEQRGHLGRLHPRLVVIEQRVVGAVEAVEAGDVAPGQLEVALEVGLERREVRLARGPRPTPPGRSSRRARARPPARRARDAPSPSVPSRPRTRRASSVSGAVPSSSASAASSRRPVSAETNISWLSRSSVASESARAARAARGHHGLLVPVAGAGPRSAGRSARRAAPAALPHAHSSLASLVALECPARHPTRLCDHCSMLRRSGSIKLMDAFGIRIGVDAQLVPDPVPPDLHRYRRPVPDGAAQLRRRSRT